MWAVIVVLPEAQDEFGVDRAAASLPYTLMMRGCAFGTIVLGRMPIDAERPRRRPAASLIRSPLCRRRAAPNVVVRRGPRADRAGRRRRIFGPLMADVSHWFVRSRGLAVVIVAAGNYLAGVMWPLMMDVTMPLVGWRTTYAGIGIVVVATVVPIALLDAPPALRGDDRRGRTRDDGGAR